MKHILGVLVENHAGVLSKVAGLFSRRGFNIDSLAVGITDDPNISRITIVVDGDEYIIEQVTKQLNKLIDVIKVVDIGDDSIHRELALIKVSFSSGKRNDLIEIINIFGAKMADINKNVMTIEISEENKKINALVDLLKDFGIKEIVRTGLIALDSGNQSIN